MADHLGSKFQVRNSFPENSGEPAAWSSSSQGQPSELMHSPFLMLHTGTLFSFWELLGLLWVPSLFAFIMESGPIQTANVFAE